MPAHIFASRVLILVFSIAIVFFDVWYYFNRKNHPTRWVKLAYAFAGLGWTIYTVLIFIDPSDSLKIMSSTASPLIAFTLGSLLSGSILRYGELREQIVLFERLKALHNIEAIESIRKDEGDHDIL